MKYRLCLIVIALLCEFASAQENSGSSKYAALIKPAELKDNLTIIASDAMEGRYTASRGQKMAAAFIANHFESVGLEAPVNGSYYQPVLLYSVSIGDCYLVAGKNRYENFTDIYYSGTQQSGGEVKSEILFLGLGRDEDLDQLDVNGKAILILVDNLSFTTLRQVRTLTAKAKNKGAKYFFVSSGIPATDFDQVAARSKSRASRGSLTVTKPTEDGDGDGTFYIKSTVAEKLFNTSYEKLLAAANAPVTKGPLKKIKPGIVSFQTTLKVENVKSENVLGYLPGSDKKDELVIVTAHFDHLGKQSSGEGDIIFNGADDDGSGTVAVLQLAKTFAQAKKDGVGPRRSMLFMTVTGEEEGLLGSKYYVANPVFPLASTVVDINIDMIGRVDPSHDADKEFVYVVGADKLSSQLHEINEQANKNYTHLNLDYLYNDDAHPDRIYYRSDHWNFAQKNIPIVFYFDGIHGDYHKVSDEVDKIDFELLATRARLAFYTAWEVANRDERLLVDKK